MRQSDRGTHSDECGLQTIRLLIVSEVRFVRESLQDILGRSSGIEVVGECAESALVWDACQECRPDMVLIDAAVRHGPATVHSLRKLAGGLHVVVFAVSESIDSVLTWAEAGAAGYIPCTAAAADLQGLCCKLDGCPA